MFSPEVVSSCFVSPWTIARQAPLSMGFPKQERWNGLPFPSPMLVVSNSSPPRGLSGSSVHGVSQARILEWVARLFSRGSFQHRDQTHVSGIGRRILYTGGFTLAKFSGPWVSQVCSFFKNSQNQLRKIINSIIPS